MARKILSIFFLILVLGLRAWAQDTDLQTVVDNKVNRIQHYLGLSQTQEIAIRPIILNYLTKRDTVLKEVAGEGIVDHVSVKTTLKTLQSEENRQLSKVLTREQMEKWINKENLLAVLNPDGIESNVDEDTTMTANGANFKF